MIDLDNLKQIVREIAEETVIKELDTVILITGLQALQVYECLL